MEKHQSISEAAALRRKAEELLKNKSSNHDSQLSEAENLRLIYELQVHQTELELQNEELCNARASAEVAVYKYISLYDQALTDQELYDKALEIAVKITDSKIGFLHQVNDIRQEIILTTRGDEAGKNRPSLSDNHFPPDKTGNWAECVRQKKPIVYNDCSLSLNKKGLPEGHVPIGRTMTVPVVENETVRLVFRVGNKTSDYSDMDVIQIQAVANDLHKILEKRKVEKDLQKNEERWQFAIEGSNDGIWDWNIITDEVFFSNRWKEMIGYGHDELEGKLSEWQTRVHADDLKAVMFKLQQHFEKKTPVYAAEHRIRCKDGSWKWILDKGKVLEWTSDGKPSRMVGTHTDITEQKAAIEEIRWRNDDLQLMNAVTHAANHDENLDSILNIISDQLHKAFNSHSLSIHLPDESTGELLMHSNTLDTALLQKIKKLTGRELPQIRLKINSEHPFSEIERSGKGLLVTGRQAVVNRLAGYLKGTNWPSLVQNLIKKMLPAICNLLEYQSAVAVPMIANGKTIGFLELGSRNIMTDHDLSRIQSIADHFAAVIVRSESGKKLRESEERYRSIFESVQEVYFEASMDGKILEVSPSIEQISKGQFSRGEMIGKSFAGMYANPGERDIYFSKLFEEKKVNDYELWLRNKDGSIFPVAVSSVLSFDTSGKPLKITGILRDITERKANEAALNKLSQAVEQSPVMVFITDLTGNIEYANPRTIELTGYTLEELIGKNPRILNSGETPKEEYRILWKTLKSGSEWRGEFHNKKKNGGLFWSAASIAPIIDNGGNLTHYLAVQEDITERKIYEMQIQDLNTDLEQKIKERTLQLSETNENLKNEIKNRVQAEAALRESQEQLELVIKGSNDAPWDWNLVTDNLFYSTKWWQQLGYAPDEIPSNSSLWRNFTHDDDTERVIGILNNALSGNNDGYEAEFRLLHKDGHYVPVLSRGYITRDATGRPIRVTGTNMDLTERNKAADVLKWNKTLLELMSNSSPLGFLVVDNRTDAILYFNHRFCQIWEIRHLEGQLRRGELKNNDIIPHCLPVVADIPAFAESCKPLQAEENRIVDEDEIAFTENRTVRRFSTQIRGENDEYFGRFYIFEDITERKRAEDEIRKAKSEAEKANLAKSEFLSRMSHELRTPMNSIIGFAQLMNMGELNPKLKKGVNHILNSGKHLLNLINEILDISGIEAGRVTLSLNPVELGKMIRETTDTFHPVTRAMQVNVELINTEHDLLFVKADHHRLRQVLLNLINNAVKYNREGGSVVIKTELQ
ncbi:MAG: PAS domain S-box protein, partial [Bacteroidetes bacterium]|nr:PAS domain S-box protein [Bacteroidota bacterium]